MTSTGIMLVTHDPQMASYADRITSPCSMAASQRWLNTDLSRPTVPSPSAPAHQLHRHAVRHRTQGTLTDEAPLPPTPSPSSSRCSPRCHWHLPSSPFRIERTRSTAQTAQTARTSTSQEATAFAPIAGPVPNIIITNFAYGGDSVCRIQNSISTSPSRTRGGWR